MKTNFLKSIFTVAVIAALSTACVDDTYETPSFDCIETTLQKNKEVVDIPASATVAQYTEDDVIEAYVTSSDKEGNFFKSVSFVSTDGTKAFSIPMDIEGTFASFEPGRKVLIKMKNLYTDIYNGGMRIGGLYANSAGEASVGRLSRAQVQASVFKSCTFKNEDEIVQQVNLVDLKNDIYINKLIEVDHVQFTTDALGKTYYVAGASNTVGGATNHLLTDNVGSTVIFRTSSFAGFAGRPVQSGSGKVRGILTKFGTDYQFLARYESDIKLTEPRFNMLVPFYTEDFQTATNNTNLNILDWTNFSELGTFKWREKTFTDNGVTNGYAEFSAFGSGSAQNVAWLVTPAINFSTFTTRIIKFDVAQHHLDVDSPNNSLQVLVSTDYDGTNVLTATWTPITANLPKKADAWYEFFNSTINISSFSGPNVYVAFKFTGSGTDTTLDGAFQVDNFKAFGQ